MSVSCLNGSVVSTAIMWLSNKWCASGVHLSVRLMCLEGVPKSWRRRLMRGWMSVSLPSCVGRVLFLFAPVIVVHRCASVMLVISFICSWSGIGLLVAVRLCIMHESESYGCSVRVLVAVAGGKTVWVAWSYVVSSSAWWHCWSCASRISL